MTCRTSFTPLLLLLVIACTSASEPSRSAPHRRIAIPEPGTEQHLRSVLDEHRIITAGVGVLRNGSLAWSYHHGEERPGLPASAQTRFNVASITKMIAAETALRLVAQGRLHLDESLMQYWIDPDLAGDARLARLTPRRVLTHTSGLPNWRFFRRDGKLAFERDPGAAYGYSGEGFEYLARAIERKLGIPFPQIVDELVFGPLAMRGAVLRVNRDDPPHLARAQDEAGVFHGHFCRPGGWCREPGSYSAADDLTLSVSDMARLLASIARHDGYPDALARERDRVHTDAGDDNIVACAATPAPTCPRAQGYGLGLQVIALDDGRIIGHSGADWSEVTLAYLRLPERDGLIIFLNAPNRRALAAMPRIIEQLDPGSPYAPQYRRWLAKADG